MGGIGYGFGDSRSLNKVSFWPFCFCVGLVYIIICFSLCWMFR